MKKLSLILAIGLLVLFSSCGGDVNNDVEDKTLINSFDNRLDLAAWHKYQTLDPIKVKEIISFYITSQIYQSLLKFDDKDFSIKPNLAESWTISDDGLVYTFHLKKGVYFHDNDCFEGGKGRELKASDVVYSFKRICSKELDNYAYTLFQEKIVGAEEFYASEKEMDRKELEGLKVIDDYTVQFTLNNVSSNFLESIANIVAAIVPQEAIEANLVVGSGPFLYTSDLDTEEKIVLKRNTNYHEVDKKGNKLPYIDAVVYHYYKKDQNRLDDFMAGKLDIITDIPAGKIKELVENQIADFESSSSKYFLERNQTISVTKLQLNTSKIPLNNKKVRQAIAHAIDKSQISENVLKGESVESANHGIVPPALKKYDYASVVGLEYDVSKARELLAEVGYKNGEGFPTLVFVTDMGNINVRTALNIQKQLLTNLNINVEISSVSFAEYFDAMQYGRGDIFITRWFAESPDALSFLSLTYGLNVSELLDEPSIINSSRYANPEFDRVYKKASETIDVKTKNELCLVADQLMINDAPIIPLWYPESYVLMQASIKKYRPNAMGFHYFNEVKIVRKEGKKQ